MASNVKVLVVDDEEDILELLEYNLQKEGYEVYKAKNGKEALDLALKVIPDIVLLDIMMPLMDGIQACQEMRKEPTLDGAYIIFLTARIEEYSEIAGFTAGADDYLSKPIKPGALLSRLRSVLKRKEKEADLEELDYGSLNIDRKSFEVTYKGEKIHFARKEFELLYMLASNPGKVFSRNDILDNIWGNDVYVGDRTIDVHIRKIREKIDPVLIKTIKGVGYKFELSN
ncbi:MAG: response regulator transcription factor [Bacteroidetes bacterium]|jgi:two-component system alkaline phosphatase synthesis response regulator PhoP|nr:response regulator transcription factor [Bacteroidota bacterium]